MGLELLAHAGGLCLDSRTHKRVLVKIFVQNWDAPVQSFPLLTLEQVYGAITFYLANRNEIDAPVSS